MKWNCNACFEVLVGNTSHGCQPTFYEDPFHMLIFLNAFIDKIGLIKTKHRQFKFIPF